MPDSRESAALARTITRSEGGVTFHLIRWLVPGPRQDNAFRAYGFFRWLDDQLDTDKEGRSERLALIRRQADIAEACYQRLPPASASPEERILIDLIDSDPRPTGTLAAYIRNMLAVECFDAERRGQIVSGRDLTEYTRLLSKAVSHALQYFIAPDPSDPKPAAFLAVAGAHIAHMLRDTSQDLQLGYFNVPREVLGPGSLDPGWFETQACRDWVRRRARLASRALRLGRASIDCSPGLRFRIAGLAYCLRFEALLQAIESQNYRLGDPSVASAGKIPASRLAVRACLQAMARQPRFSVERQKTLRSAGRVAGASHRLPPVRAPRPSK